MKKIYRFATGMIAVAALSASAAPLTPQQALDAARASVSGQMRAKGADMSLAYTLSGTNGPALYVFNHQDAQTPGFVIVSADDVARPMLGYSDDSTFDPDNIPPQLKWWLECYAVAIEQLVADPANAALRNLANNRASEGMMKSVRRASHAAIAPLCSTTWNQDSPYNDECPMVDGGRSVTGCMATAMAQVLKVHNWPQTGTGTHTYSFDSPYSGSSYSDTFNFGATTFQWSYMLDSYSGNSTTNQKRAVAKLMHACGNAASMNYNPESSGANDYLAAKGLLDYLKIDQAMTVERREWYLAADWDNLVYGELAEGRPVLYTGSTQNYEGHAFVCDGYNGSDYYHINWGWGGVADGYYLLADLAPSTQGIGGSALMDPFNYYQTAFIGLKKAESGSKLLPLFACSNLYTDRTTYSRDFSTVMQIRSDDNFYNYSSNDLSNVCFGLILEGNGGTETLQLTDFYSFPQLYGFEGLDVATSEIPVGTWKAYLAASTDGVNWTKMRFDPTQTAGYLNLTVTSSQITVGETSGEDDPGQQEVTVQVSLDESTATSTCYLGETYTYDFNFTSTGAFSNEYCFLLANNDDNSIVAFGDAMTVSSSTAGTVTTGFDITIPESLSLDGDYFVALCSVEGGYYYIEDYMFVNVAEPVVQVEVSMVKDTATTVCYLGETYTYNFNFTSNGAFSNDYYFVLVNYNTNLIEADGDAWIVSSDHAGTITESFSITIPENLDLTGDYYLALCSVDSDNYLQIEDYIWITLQKRGMTDDVEVEWAALQPDDDKFVVGKTYDLTFSFSADAGFNGSYYAVISEPVAVTVTDDFEDYDGFTANCGSWTMADMDGRVVGGISGVDLPCITVEETTGAFWVWDNSQVTGVNGSGSHSGNKHLFNMFNDDGSANNDWLISPELSGDAQTISFYAKSFSGSYLESLKVFASEDGTDPGDFSLVQGSYVKSVPSEWTKYMVELPEGTRYFAIVCCSTDQFMLFIDDVTYTANQKTIFAYSDPMNVYSETGSTVDATCSLTIPEDARIGDDIYKLHVCNLVGNTFHIMKTWDISVTDVESTVDSVNQTDEAEAETLYFDMLGRRVATPQAGSIYIEKKGTNVRKHLTR